MLNLHGYYGTKDEVPKDEDSSLGQDILDHLSDIHEITWNAAGEYLDVVGDKLGEMGEGLVKLKDEAVQLWKKKITNQLLILPSRFLSDRRFYRERKTCCWKHVVFPLVTHEKIPAPLQHNHIITLLTQKEPAEH